MKEVIQESRLSQLEGLLEVLADAIDNGPGARDLSQLAKQYRETLYEIEVIKESGESDDEIGEIMSRRKTEGKSDSIR